LNKLLHNLAQNLNTLQKNLPTQYELGVKCPHAEGLTATEYLEAICIHNLKRHYAIMMDPLIMDVVTV
jgi:hypothetical protein